MRPSRSCPWQVRFLTHFTNSGICGMLRLPVCLRLLQLIDVPYPFRRTSLLVSGCTTTERITSAASNTYSTDIAWCTHYRDFSCPHSYFTRGCVHAVPLHDFHWSSHTAIDFAHLPQLGTNDDVHRYRPMDVGDVHTNAWFFLRWYSATVPRPTSFNEYASCFPRIGFPHECPFRSLASQSRDLCPI